MMKLWTACLSTALVGLLLLTGCESSPKAAQQEKADYPQVTAQDGLDEVVAYDEPVVKAEEGQPMTVVVPVRVMSEQGVDAQYRYIFFDADGAPIEPMMEWRYQSMPGNEQVFLGGASLDPGATDWRLEIRPAR